MNTHCSFDCIHFTYSITYKNYRKAKKLYSRRGKNVCPIQELVELLKLSDAYEWYEYKGRVMIFRPKHKVASFVIKDNKIYNPLIACGGLSYYDILYRDMDYDVYSHFMDNFYMPLIFDLYQYINDIDMLIYLNIQKIIHKKSLDYSINI